MTKSHDEDDDTKILIVRMSENLKALTEAVGENTRVSKLIPILEFKTSQHDTRITKHGEQIDKLSSDVNKAKGWAACFGAVTGFLSGFIKH